MSSSSEPCRKPKAYGLHSFAEPGVLMDFSGAFRDNVRSFLCECAAVEDYNVEGLPVWNTLLVDEKSGVVVPLYVVEESIMDSENPFCDFCRCIGWSHHFVSKRRYHLIIPADDEWDKPLDGRIYRLQNHILHGLIHCNGFGHLLCINGYEGGSKYIRGRDVLDLWDRICTTLRTREVSVEDVSRKRSMELRLLYGVAYGHPWFGRWGYKFRHGSFGITEQKYEKSIDILSSLDLDMIMEDFGKTGRDKEINQIIHCYRNMSNTELVSVRDLLRFMLEFKSRVPLQRRIAPLKPSVLIAPAQQRKLSSLSNKNKKDQKCQDFAVIAADISSRWSGKRLELAAQVIVDALKESIDSHSSRACRGMSRQDVRDAARQQIGDTGLLDFVLKSIGNCIVGNYIVRRENNPSTRILEFTLEDVAESVRAEPVPELVSVGEAEIRKDIVHFYKNVFHNYPRVGSALVPLAVRIVLDSKHFVKVWPFRDDEDEMLRFMCRVMLYEEDAVVLSRPLAPPELLVLPPHATVGELKWAAEKAMRDTYCIMEGFVTEEMEGVNGDDWEPLFGAAESGSMVWVRGSGLDLKSEFRYEGGADNWTVDCVCGARDDDGERMVACDLCEVWQHTRCEGIDDADAVPQLFLCSRCSSALMPVAAGNGMIKMDIDLV